MVHYQRIGEMLIERGLLTEGQLQKALETKLTSSLRFGELLTALGFVSEDDVAQCLADQYGHSHVEPSELEPDPEALALVPATTAITGLVLPYKVTRERLYCVVADPLDIWLTDSLMRMTGRAVDYQVAAPTPLFEAITRHYELDPHVKRANLVAKSGLAPAKAPRKPRRNFAPAPATTTKPKRKKPMPIDPQHDKFELLDAVTLKGKLA